jgi:hypothetical protein
MTYLLLSQRITHNNAKQRTTTNCQIFTFPTAFLPCFPRLSSRCFFVGRKRSRAMTNPEELPSGLCAIKLMIRGVDPFPSFHSPSRTRVISPPSFFTFLFHRPLFSSLLLFSPPLLSSSSLLFFPSLPFSLSPSLLLSSLPFLYPP